MGHGENDSALVNAETAVALAEQTRAPSLLGSAYMCLARACEPTDPARAADYYERAVDAGAEDIAAGYAAAHLGHSRGDLDLLGQALRWHHRTYGIGEIGFTIALLAMTLHEKGDNRAAAVLYHGARHLAPQWLDIPPIAGKLRTITQLPPPESLPADVDALVETGLNTIEQHQHTNTR